MGRNQDHQGEGAERTGCITRVGASGDRDIDQVHPCVDGEIHQDSKNLFLVVIFSFLLQTSPMSSPICGVDVLDASDKALETLGALTGMWTPFSQILNHWPDTLEVTKVLFKNH